MKKRNPIAADLRTPKYKMRVVPDKKKQENKQMCREKESVEVESLPMDRNSPEYALAWLVDCAKGDRTPIQPDDVLTMRNRVRMKIDMLEKQNSALQKHNNQLLERARRAEMKLKKGSR